jgi:hypothetical protein
MDHGAVSQDRQVEAVAVKRYEPRVQVGDLADERGDQLLLSSVADVRGSEGVHHPVVAFRVRHECTDAHDGVVDVLGELVPMASRTSSSVLPTRPLAAANPRRSGTVSRSQTMTLPFMGANVAQRTGIEKDTVARQMPGVLLAITVAVVVAGTVLAPLDLKGVDTAPTRGGFNGRAD